MATTTASDMVGTLGADTAATTLETTSMDAAFFTNSLAAEALGVGADVGIEAGITAGIGLEAAADVGIAGGVAAAFTASTAAAATAAGAAAVTANTLALEGADVAAAELIAAAGPDEASFGIAGLVAGGIATGVGAAAGAAAAAGILAAVIPAFVASHKQQAAATLLTPAEAAKSIVALAASGTPATASILAMAQTAVATGRPLYSVYTGSSTILVSQLSTTKLAGAIASYNSNNEVFKGIPPPVLTAMGLNPLLTLGKLPPSAGVGGNMNITNFNVAGASQPTAAQVLIAAQNMTTPITTGTLPTSNVGSQLQNAQPNIPPSTANANGQLAASLQTSYDQQYAKAYYTQSAGGAVMDSSDMINPTALYNSMAGPNGITGGGAIPTSNLHSLNGLNTGITFGSNGQPIFSAGLRNNVLFGTPLPPALQTPNVLATSGQTTTGTNTPLPQKFINLSSQQVVSNQQASLDAQPAPAPQPVATAG